MEPAYPLSLAVGNLLGRLLRRDQGAARLPNWKGARKREAVDASLHNAIPSEKAVHPARNGCSASRTGLLAWL